VGLYLHSPLRLCGVVLSYARRLLYLTVWVVTPYSVAVAHLSFGDEYIYICVCVCTALQQRRARIARLSRCAFLLSRWCVILVRNRKVPPNARNGVVLVKPRNYSLGFVSVRSDFTILGNVAKGGA